MADAALSLSYIGRLHRVPGAAPAAGSCRYAAAGNQSGNSDGEDRLDNDPIPTMTLHLHSFLVHDPWHYSSYRTGVTRMAEVRVEIKCN